MRFPFTSFKTSSRVFQDLFKITFNKIEPGHDVLCAVIRILHRTQFYCPNSPDWSSYSLKVKTTLFL